MDGLFWLKDECNVADRTAIAAEHAGSEAR